MWLQQLPASEPASQSCSGQSTQSNTWSLFMGTLKLSLLMLLALPCCSQDTPATPPSTDQNSTQVEPMEQTPVFRVNVVGRTTPAVNYHFRSGSTKVDMRGTELMPKATGSAKVESHLGRISVNATAHHLDDPKRFGTEYLTYVLWAISPE